MILCYAWTDTQIDNLICIRRGIYPDQKVDLLIYRLSRISSKLIEVVKAARIFDHIYILEMPNFYLERCRKRFSEKLEAVFLGSKYRDYFSRQLNHLIGGKEYSHFLTSAFWSESLLVIRYLRKCQADIRIMLYEEGLSAYNGPQNWLFHAVPNRSMKAKIRTVLYYGMTSFTYRKYVDGIYLYKPELSNVDYLEKRQIPLAAGQIEIFHGWRDNSEETENVYRQCDVIYIAEAPKAKSGNRIQNVYEVLDAILFVKKDAKVVVKAHPTMQSIGAAFDEEHRQNVYFDYRSARIESILSKIEIDEKIIIAGNSAGPLYIRWVYGKNPYIILMCLENKKALREYAHRFIESCETGKAYALKDKEELKRVLNLISTEKAED